MTGTLKVEYTRKLKNDLKKYGNKSHILIEDKIRDMEHVTNVLTPKSWKIDLIVESDATSMDNLKKQILGLEGVYRVM